ncbi:hypothetical protein OG216_46670 (plasmid) [Streptomycetaceae bacterium NBC_01309]
MGLERVAENALDAARGEVSGADEDWDTWELGDLRAQRSTFDETRRVAQDLHAQVVDVVRLHTEMLATLHESVSRMAERYQVVKEARDAAWARLYEVIRADLPRTDLEARFEEATAEMCTLDAGTETFGGRGDFFAEADRVEGRFAELGADADRRVEDAAARKRRPGSAGRRPAN